eukprot:366384-Chlamydomonas_euryale.AAC.3
MERSATRRQHMARSAAQQQQMAGSAMRRQHMARTVAWRQHTWAVMRDTVSRPVRAEHLPVPFCTVPGVWTHARVRLQPARLLR